THTGFRCGFEKRIDAVTAESGDVWDAVLLQETDDPNGDCHFWSLAMSAAWRASFAARGGRFTADGH
ncbi:MAG: hypothetical protein HYZ37_16205, partial [Candidatus Solibacter usitatus]|nr:hypothetical protein [Candidatus Solibacter usitatus]